MKEGIDWVSLIFACSYVLSDYGRVLDWCADLFDSFIQRVSTLYSSLVHTQLRLHCRCLAAALNGGRSPSSGPRNCARLQLRASHSSSSPQRLSNSPTVCNPWRALHVTFWHGRRRKQLSCCSAIVAFMSVGVIMWSLLTYYLTTAVVCRAFTQQRLLYTCLFLRRCVTTVLHATILSNINLRTEKAGVAVLC
jgi:hypothetical protein